MSIIPLANPAPWIEVKGLRELWHRVQARPGDRIVCEAPGGCPHTAAWLTDAGFLYCQGHKYLGDNEAELAFLAGQATGTARKLRPPTAIKAAT